MHIITRIFYCLLFSNMLFVSDRFGEPGLLETAFKVTLKRFVDSMFVQELDKEMRDQKLVAFSYDFINKFYSEFMSGQHESMFPEMQTFCQEYERNCTDKDVAIAMKRAERHQAFKIVLMTMIANIFINECDRVKRAKMQEDLACRLSEKFKQRFLEQGGDQQLYDDMTQFCKKYEEIQTKLMKAEKERVGQPVAQAAAGPVVVKDVDPSNEDFQRLLHYKSAKPIAEPVCCDKYRADIAQKICATQGNVDIQIVQFVWNIMAGEHKNKSVFYTGIGNELMIVLSMLSLERDSVRAHELCQKGFLTREPDGNLSIKGENIPRFSKFLGMYNVYKNLFKRMQDSLIVNKFDDFARIMQFMHNDRQKYQQCFAVSDDLWMNAADGVKDDENAKEYTNVLYNAIAEFCPKNASRHLRQAVQLQAAQAVAIKKPVAASARSVNQQASQVSASKEATPGLLVDEQELERVCQQKEKEQERLRKLREFKRQVEQRKEDSVLQKIKEWFVASQWLPDIRNRIAQREEDKARQRQQKQDLERVIQANKKHAKDEKKLREKRETTAHVPEPESQLPKVELGCQNWTDLSQQEREEIERKNKTRDDRISRRLAQRLAMVVQANTTHAEHVEQARQERAQRADIPEIVVEFVKFDDQVETSYEDEQVRLQHKAEVRNARIARREQRRQALLALEETGWRWNPYSLACGFITTGIKGCSKKEPVVENQSCGATDYYDNFGYQNRVVEESDFMAAFLRQHDPYSNSFGCSESLPAEEESSLGQDSPPGCQQTVVPQPSYLNGRRPPPRY